jgi:5-methylcytosine-specific restriction protein A
MRFCARPGCPVLVQSGYCATHRPARPAPAYRSWYQTREWRSLRALVLRLKPVCPGVDGVPCGDPTTDVDHRVPHRGDPRLFWNVGNLDAYCHQHHAVKTGRGF